MTGTNHGDDAAGAKHPHGGHPVLVVQTDYQQGYFHAEPVNRPAVQE